MEKKLGFGGMRLPLADPKNSASIDHAELVRMVDRFLGEGFDYFDTAWTYLDGHGETALRRALVERHPRTSYRLADKLPTLLIEAADQQERIFAEQLTRCGVDYFDRYIVHCATAAFYERAERFGSFDFALRLRDEGRVREAGFSYHDSPELLDAILTRYPTIDFVQLQISYIDWLHTPIQARACYETARRHGKPVVAMCPLKGGMLADLPAEAARLLRYMRPEWRPAAWALRYVASLEGVERVLSGMGSLAELEANMAALDPFEPLTEAELAAVERAAEIICRAVPIQCTGCGYCEPVCPRRIPIPADLKLYNAQHGAGGRGTAERMAAYEAAAAGRGRASECLGCRNCERACPQHLRIAEWLKRVAVRFEQPCEARA